MSTDSIKIEVLFDTFSLPAPFAYKYDLKAEVYPNKVKARFNIEYYDRDELSPEEIEAEGFSENDDFNWEGELAGNWPQVLQALTSKSSPSKETKSQFQFFKIIDNKKIAQRFDNDIDCPYLIQELIQAIYEVCEKQNPLAIEIIDQNQKATNKVTITCFFKNRTLAVIKNNKKSSVNWEVLKPFMEKLYSLPFDSMKSQFKKPKGAGSYINPGDGLWYTLPKKIESNKNIQTSSDYLESLYNVLKF